MIVEENIVTEETGLLSRKNPQLDIYDHFSPRRKRVILALVSWCGLLPCNFIMIFLSSLYLLITLELLVFVSGSFVPCIPQIARDLGTTGSVIKYVPYVL